MHHSKAASDLCERHDEILKVAVHALFHLLPFRVVDKVLYVGFGVCRRAEAVMFLLMPSTCFLAATALKLKPWQTLWKH